MVRMFIAEIVLEANRDFINLLSLPRVSPLFGLINDFRQTTFKLLCKTKRFI